MAIEKHPPPTRTDIELGDVTKHNIMLKQVNDATLPVHYSESFYLSLLTCCGDTCKLAYFNDVIVGAVTCRIKEDSGDGRGRRMCVMTVATLAPYRGYGVGTMLMRHAVEMAEVNDVQLMCLNVQVRPAVALNPPVNNESAIAFYEKLGFKIMYRRHDYYEEGIEPRDAFHMEKVIREQEGGARCAG